MLEEEEVEEVLLDRWNIVVSVSDSRCPRESVRRRRCRVGMCIFLFFFFFFFFWFGLVGGSERVSVRACVRGSGEAQPSFPFLSFPFPFFIYIYRERG